MPEVSSKSPATPPRVSGRNAGARLARRGALVLSTSAVAFFGLSPLIAPRVPQALPEPVPSVEELAKTDLAMPREEIRLRAALRETTLLEPVPLSTVASDFAQPDVAALPMSVDSSADPSPRPIGQSQAQIFNLSPSRALILAYASLPAPEEILASAELETGSIPPEPEEVSPLVPLPPERETAEPAENVPVPMPRPADARDVAKPDPAAPARSERPTATASLPAPEPAPSSDNRGFFQKFLGYGRTDDATKPEAPTTSSDKASGRSLLSALFGPSTSAGPGTAVYNISTKTLTLPNGERLEAHSGLGDKRDNPLHVNVSMRGATPPHTYDITEREALFHGVQALRLTPVGGAGAIYGRVGLLAHPYMLGPRGDSNGCVSVKGYERLLQAYRRGEVRRLVVVANAS
jgi:hypothetical protein